MAEINPVLAGETPCIACAHKRTPQDAVGRSPCDLFRDRSIHEARQACAGDRWTPKADGDHANG